MSLFFFFFATFFPLKYGKRKTNTPDTKGLVSLSGTQVTKKEDFQPLAQAIAAVNANASTNTVSMASYTPSNEPRACPAVNANSWLAAEALPPTPNTTVCENMVAASACVPSTALASNADAMASLFGTVCGLDASACKGIAANATTGTYGAYVMCNTTQKLASALNTYYTNQKKASTACDFNGAARIVTPSETLLPVSSSNSGSSSSGSSVSSNSNTNTNSSSSSSSTSTGVPVGGAASPQPSSSGSASSVASGSTAGAGDRGSNSTSVANSNGVLSANSGNSTQSSSSGSGTSGAHRSTTMLGNAGWAGSLLVAVGAVALTL